MTEERNMGCGFWFGNDWIWIVIVIIILCCCCGGFGPGYGGYCKR